MKKIQYLQAVLSEVAFEAADIGAEMISCL
jgi:hypothetical protein